MVRRGAVVVLERGENGLRDVLSALLRYRVLQISLEGRWRGGLRAASQIRICALHVVKKVLDPLGLQDNVTFLVSVPNVIMTIVATSSKSFAYSSASLELS